MSLLYDYYGPSEKTLLIYVGRIPDAESDPGIYVTPTVLRTLYNRGLLTGEALQDAKRL